MAAEASPSTIAESVLVSVGGKENVRSNSLCMTRLRLRIVNPAEIDDKALEAIPGVLGLASRGTDGIEVVFGPRLVPEVYNAFVGLTGLDPNEEDLIVGTSPLASNLRVRISSSPQSQTTYLKPLVAARDVSSASDASRDSANEGDGTSATNDSDLAGLTQLYAQDESGDENAMVHGAREITEAHGPRLLILNGPNINMLGIREPNIYGHRSYDDLLTLCKQTAAEVGFGVCSCFQSNHEGDIIDRIQDAYQTYDGIIINPAALTHTSVALLDALRAVEMPAIEVHLSDVDKREPYRQISYVRDACFETISGMGFAGYAKAIKDMAAYLEENE